MVLSPIQAYEPASKKSASSGSIVLESLPLKHRGMRALHTVTVPIYFCRSLMGWLKCQIALTQFTSILTLFHLQRLKSEYKLLSSRLSPRSISSSRLTSLVFQYLLALQDLPQYSGLRGASRLGADLDRNQHITCRKRSKCSPFIRVGISDSLARQRLLDIILVSFDVGLTVLVHPLKIHIHLNEHLDLNGRSASLRN